MHDEGVEQTKVSRFLGVPEHIYRRAVSDFVSWAGQVLRGNLTKALTQEVGIWFCFGFRKARWRECLSSGGEAPLRGITPTV